MPRRSAQLGVDQRVEIANEGTSSIVKVHTGKGNKTVADLYNSELVWNRKHDTVTLKDATGKIYPNTNLLFCRVSRSCGSLMNTMPRTSPGR